MQSRTCLLAGIGVCLLVAFGGCSREFYRNSADRQVYGIIEQKSAKVPGMLSEFTIEPSPQTVLRDCPLVTDAPPYGSQPPAVDDSGVAEPAPPAALVSLTRALEIAAHNSREYQSQKESVYLSALSLTLSRYAFDPQFFWTISGDYNNTDSGDEELVSGRNSFGFSRLFRTGTMLTVSLLSDISEYLTGDPRRAQSSLFSVAVTQPLLRGAGIAVTEPLTQAERNVIYQIRDFVRFRRSFFVQVLSAYYRVLENLQVLENERSNYDSLVFSRRRAEALSEAGRLPPFQVDQTRQDELRAADRVELSRQSYEGSLDDFKLTLGLPTEAHIALDPGELQRLATASVQELGFELADASGVALAHRLDLMTAGDQLQDAARKVQVAANDLLPGLDLSAGLNWETSGNTLSDFDGSQIDLSAGFELDLPLDRLSERNTYRSQLISLERSQRDLCETRDRVLLSVRNSWRQYQRARSSYQIQARSVALAEQRVESVRMLLDADRAITRDLLEAQEALRDARNALAAAVVDFRVARLALARDMGILHVTETGQLEERFNEYL